jgi:hypothetical protein
MAPRDKRPWPIAAPSARLATKPLVAAMAAMGRRRPQERLDVIDIVAGCAAILALAGIGLVLRL